MLWPSQWALNQNFRRLKLIATVLTVAVLSFSAVALADTIVRGYNAKVQLQPGWIVTLSKGATNTVEAAPAENPSRIFGVVIDPSKAPVTLQPQQGQKVFVATSGTYPVLVNTQKGAIAAGDYITISHTDGIGGKAGATDSTILGQALEAFDAHSNVIAAGESGSAIGRVSVTITPGRNPLNKNQAAVPSILRRAGEAIAGKNLSASRIYAALLIFLATAFIAGMVLWTGVRSGMVSIGRNPLSRHLIFQGLIQVIIASVLVFVIGLFAVYLLLKI